MELDKIEQDRNHVMNLPVDEILSRDKYEELIPRAIMTLLTLMKQKNLEIKTLMPDTAFRNSPEYTSRMTELDLLEADYLDFEENMDQAEVDDEIKAHLKECARNVVAKHFI